MTPADPNAQPGRPYRYRLDRFWPDLPEDDPAAARLIRAWREAAEPADRPEAARRLLTVTCSHQRHGAKAGVAPRLAEVWQTSEGRLFVARIPGRREGRLARRRTSPPPPLDWDPIPYTEAIWLIDDPAQPVLPCACPDHGSLEVGRETLVAHVDAMTAAPMGGGSVEIQRVAYLLSAEAPPTLG